MVSFRHDTPGTPSDVWRRAVAERHVASVSLDGIDRVVVAAAHPDDETLGAGGLVTRSHQLGLVVDVVVASRGENSHPGSPTHDRARLAERREEELREAVSILAPGLDPRVLDIDDGSVRERQDDLTRVLVELLGDGRDALVLAPWRGDGHPDHEAAGRAASAAARRTGARLLEYPVWAWHWADPAELPWPEARRLDLTVGERERKARAVRAHRSQVAPLSPAPGDEALLDAALLEHFFSPYEVFWEQPAIDEALEELHLDDPDPWGVDHRWYEERKRGLVLAMLPRPRFRRALEVGCSTGALTAVLAERADELTAVDCSAAAAGSARLRLEGREGVEVACADVPQWWPTGRLDLVVLSEVGYFMSPEALDQLGERVRQTLSGDGVVVLAHWRHPIEGWPLDGPQVHTHLCETGLPPVVASYSDRDVEILVLADAEQMPDPREGVR